MQINKLLTELQFRKHLGWVKHEGAVLAQPLRIAKALCDQWTAVT